MKTETKIRKNIVSGFVYQILTLLLGITIPRLVLVNLGSETNGLLSSVNQVLVYLALFEGGMGLSITQSLYGPIAKHEYDEINGIMSAANIFYKHVGLCYFVGLLVIATIYPLTVTSSLESVEIFAVAILSGLPQVINFFFQGKYRTLISVNGKGYVLTNLNTVVAIGSNICKIILLISGLGVVALQTMYCALSLIQMIFIIWYVKKEFPWLNIKVKPAKEKIGQRSSVFLHQISGFIFSNTDAILLTYFCDLKMVSVYSLYSTFFSMIGGMISNITGSLVFAMGQKFNSDREGYLRVQNIFETVNMVLVFSCYSVLCLCILPFLKIYTFGITDTEYIYLKLPYFFAVIQLLQAGRFSSQKVIEYAGEFRNTQWHSACEAIINIVVSVVCVIKFDIYGVLMGTIAALLFRSVAMIYYACKRILHTKQSAVYRKWSINVILFIVLQILGQKIGITPASYLGVILYAAILMLITLLLFGFAGILYDKESFDDVVSQLKMRIKVGG